MKTIKFFFTSLMLFMFLMAASFFSRDASADNQPRGSGDDKIKTHRFTLGDSILEVPTAPNTDVYVEADDSAGSGTDTHKVYIKTSSGTLTLAYLKKVNVADTGAQVYSNGVIIPGANTTVFFKVVYPYPGTIVIIRSNVATLTDVSHVTVKSQPKEKSMKSYKDSWAVLNPEARKLGLRQIFKL